MKPTTSSLGLALMLLGAAAVPAAAQSLLGSTGLGLPLAPLDARARALGGVGVGVPGAALSAVDPAAAADLTIPALTFTLQSSWVEATQGDATGDFSGTRFPSIAASYPVSGLGTLSLGLSSVLDQRWRVERQSTILLEGTGSLARVTDTFDSDGGVSSVRLGFARRIAPSLALGVQVGTHTGEVVRRFSRSFDSLEVETSVPSFQIGGQWGYRGLTAAVGAAVDVGEVLHVAGSYTWSADLEAEPTEDTEGGARSFAMPSELRLGATAALTPALGLTAGVHQADWSAAGDGLEDGVGARSTLSYGAGLEWSEARILGKDGAVRLGWRRDELPFTTADAPDPRESAFTGGLGLDLLASDGVPLALLDLTLERGLREAGTVEERFWRLVTSVRISGF